ncbi:hypothetical protein C0992_007774 [Termitomyces sp. T32_za158]|nr:hypothetical protein C0992_007774 [Termitomyces sp. T32_za158]
MPSSELSNALNPYANQPRPRPGYGSPYEQHDLPPPPQPSPYVTQLPVPQPPLPPPAPPQPNPASIHAVQELLRFVASTRDAQDAERIRRLNWERQQEAKYAQQHAEMERKLQQLTQEVITLRASNSTRPSSPAASGLLTPQQIMSPQQLPQLATPVSPVSQSPSYPYPAFVQGSSSSRFPETSILQTPISAVTPSPSPHLNFVQPGLSVPPSHGKKRQSSELSSDGDTSGSDSSSTSTHRVKRINHHDTRCLTVHHAMRAHILLMMKLDSGKQLPDSHIEGETLGPDDPVRFVWDKTTKQSVHNTRMKSRILADIKENRKKYKYVPDKDFGKKNLESCFEACFVTLRQKFKAQHNPDDAKRYKKREDLKARRARHVSRKKLKLSNRAEARAKVEALEHVIFDGALQLECMSSDDSEDDNGSRPPGMLYTRGHQWRSARLKRFYDILDEEEKQDKHSMPKRGLGKKERCIGAPKDFALPPGRVASWMISKRWIKDSQARYSDLSTVLRKRIEDPPGFDCKGFDVLGEESDVPTDEVGKVDGEKLMMNYALV